MSIDFLFKFFNLEEHFNKVFSLTDYILMYFNMSTNDFSFLTVYGLM